jgi:DNA-binding Lrp family transcriptional regulator
MKVDHIDTTILSELTINARASQVDLAERVGLSSTAIARRQKALEEEGFILGYQAVLDLTRFGLTTTVNGMVRSCSCPASKRSWQGAPKTRSTPCLRHPIPRSP